MRILFFERIPALDWTVRIAATTGEPETTAPVVIPVTTKTTVVQTTTTCEFTKAQLFV